MQDEYQFCQRKFQITAFKEFGLDQGCKYFVETGTLDGDSVYAALEFGFEKIMSCELHDSRFSHCQKRFKDNSNVFLWQGMSRNILPEMIKMVDKKALFWLDAHLDGGGQPIFDELEIIKDSKANNHRILVDDMRFFDVNEIKRKILEINDSYKFIGIRTSMGSDWDVLGAYID